MSSETGWGTKLTDKLRELLFPALALVIVGSIWAMGYLGEKEAILAENYVSPIDEPRRIDSPDEEDGPSDAVAAPDDAPAAGLITSAAE